MAGYVLEKKSDMTAIADAIREKIGTTGRMTVANMAGLISAIKTVGGEMVVGNHKVLLGQTTPDASGLIDVALGVNIPHEHSVFIWLDDTSVVANYADTAVVLSYTQNQYARTFTHVDCVLNGTRKSYNKSANSIQVTGTLAYGTLSARSQTNSAYAEWYVLIPETYNYMIVYD